MLKIIAMFKFRPDKSYDECRSYWTDVHAELIATHLPECRRYVQDVPVDIQSRTWSVDGVAELWFDDLDSIRRSFRGELADRLRQDETNFADASQSTWLIVSENDVDVLTRGPS